MPASADERIRALAYYLPQFHRIPENDHCWGDGFTEWTTVRAARPLYPGHWQPRHSSELGFYDLSDDGIRERQAVLAQEAGLEGFIYWHYWFSGKRLLQMPSERLLATDRPRFGFCFAWANVSWSRAWAGNHRDVLIRQEYQGAEDYRAHYDHLRRAFDDDRYVRVHGRPLFLIFRPGGIPDLREFVTVWRDAAERRGESPPYLVGEADFTDGDPPWLDRQAPLLDGIVELGWIRAIGRLGRVRRHLPGAGRPVRVPYARVAASLSLRRPDLGVPQFPLVLTGWDNTPRYGRSGIVMEGYAPDALESALAEACAWVRPREQAERLVILKSWNEWAEGNYLEPDERHGRAWIDACARGVDAA